LRPYGGDEKIFINFMNQKARLLGLGQTRFSNTQGFDDEKQYSNVYDLAKIARYAQLNYPLINQAAATAYSRLEKNQNHGFYHLPNWNALLGTYPGVQGLKIGYTDKAGHCTIVTAEKKGISLIVIVMGAGSIIDRDLAAAVLLNYAFAKEGEQTVTIDQSLIKPRIDEWDKLRDRILKEIKNKK
jgi:D-alanyl-D-alanine carboxypeptidase (penicillin-binding protein 5/6)